MDLSAFGKLLLGIGAFLVVIGVVLVFGGRLPGLSGLGRLPGDIFIKRDNFTFYFPVTTGILISIILTGIVWLLFRR
jgi:DUF2905 family protein